MATPMQHLPAPTPDISSARPSTPSLDDVFLPMLGRLALVPIRSGAEGVPGLIADDGLTAPTLRALAIRWCRAEVRRGRFDPDEVRGLELALHHFSTAELRDLIRGAIIAYGL